MTQILLIEDDPGIGRGLRISLEAEKYKVTWLQDLKSAEKLNPQDFNLILLDLNLPDGNGLSYLRSLRSMKDETPVIILTARTDENSVVEGLTIGANDYVKKPFSHRELLARIRSSLRQKQEAPLKYHDLSALVEQRKIYYQDREIELNRREFDILLYFILHAEAVVSRDVLLSVLNKGGEIFDRTIDSHVSHVRSRLKKAEAHSVQITSVYGVGYRLEARQH